MLNLIGVLVAFLLIIFLIRMKQNFGASLMIGAIIVGFFSLEVISIIDIPKAFLTASLYSVDNHEFRLETIELALLLFFIYMLARTMQETHAIDQLIISLKTIFSKTAILGIIPAIYGLMPVPGGALFSAPMVDKEGEIIGLNKNQKNFINIWFRHIWFTIYPVSSAMILVSSSQMFAINIYDLVFIQVPMFLTMILVGGLLLRRFSSYDKSVEKKNSHEYYGLIYLFAPILPLITSAFLMPIGVSQIRSFLIGVVFSIMMVLVLARISIKIWAATLRKGVGWRLPLAIFGIMIFREMFAVSEIDTAIGLVISDLAIPPILFFAIIPFFFGLVMGYNLGAIGISFPILAAFLPVFNYANPVALASVLYMSSFVGYLLSPLHLCNVVSSEYLKINTTGMYKSLIPAGLLLLMINTLIMEILL